MGTMTEAEIVAAGLALQGNTGLTAPATTYFRAWVADLYGSHPWRYLTQRYGPLALGQGVSSLEIGDGTLTADKLLHIARVELGTTEGPVGELTITAAEDVNVWQDPALAQAGQQAVPSSVLVGPAAASAPYRWKLEFNPVPNRAFKLMVHATRRPADGLTTPLHPNDLTLIHAVYVWALRHQEDERFAAEENNLNQMVKRDMVKYGKRPGLNGAIGLDKTKFTQQRIDNRGRTAWWRGWGV